MRPISRQVIVMLFCAALCGGGSSVAKADTALYTNGPTNGTYGALEITGPMAVEDSFTLSSASTLTSVTFGNWVTNGQTALSVYWAVVSGEGSLAPACGTCSGTATLTEVTTPVTNGGYYVVDQSFSLPGVDLPAGAYWLELGNETTNGVDEIAFWDENGGPSMVWYSLYGDLSGANCSATFTNQAAGSCSNAFTIYGTAAASTTPEPGSFLLLGSAVALLGARTRRRYFRHA